ncbi:hypothetical protein DdX_20152 [Ditylenchus destructor]|uniref:Uncharacterized protein n=1 Tax=Ditylenchus destructor TaxID=166010 RepID=A0AAD4MGT2_9BILA|nr:hypothetical protein DdX_20152 [Ditylenchus destructor]
MRKYEKIRKRLTRTSLTPEQQSNERQKNANQHRQIREQTRNAQLEYKPFEMAEGNYPYKDFGDLQKKCVNCNALHFQNEFKRNQDHPGSNVFFKCCDWGNVEITVEKTCPFKGYPKTLYEIVTAINAALAKPFHEHIRNYNCAFALGSLKTGNDCTPQGWPYCYKIQGNMYSLYNETVNPGDKTPAYGQLYYMDSEKALEFRCNEPSNKHCNKELMKIIQDVMEQSNPLAKSYKMMKDVEKEVQDEIKEKQKRDPEAQMPKLRLVFTDKGVDQRRFNIPQVNEVAAIFRIDDYEEVPRDNGIVVYYKDDKEKAKLKVLNKYQKQREAIIYPLFFPTGLGGWTPKMHKNHPEAFWNCTWNANPDLIDFNPLRVGTKLY